VRYLNLCEFRSAKSSKLITNEISNFITQAAIFARLFSFYYLVKL